MKNLILTISIIFTMCVGASAQSDGFFNYDQGSYDRALGDSAPAMPTHPIGSTENGDAPLGSGLLIMSALGAGYLVKRLKRK